MSPLAFSVLRLLDDGNSHTIGFLALSLNVSQRDIINTINNIDQYGVVLRKVDVFGYQWLNQISWLDEKEILSNIHYANFPFQLSILDSIDSTNKYLLDQLVEPISSPHRNLVIITELQTQGRGRLGRRWYSGLGDSLTFSLSWRFDCPWRRLSGLSLATGIAIIRALTIFGIKDLKLKWPNDVLFRFQKLAGILIELRNDFQRDFTVVIGIGLNIQLSTSTKDNIDQAFVDLLTITGRKINRNKLLAVLLSELTTVLTDFSQFGFSYFRDEWISYHAYEGKLIAITLPDKSVVTGVVDGVAFDGSIILNLEAGGKSSFSSGELSLR